MIRKLISIIILASLPGNVIQKVHPAAHALLTASTFAKSLCSATAVGPHALLTASHCEKPSDTFLLEDGPHKIVGAPLRDDADHSIFLTDATFTSYAEIGCELEQGDEVFIFGNPAGHLDLLRKGYLAGTEDGALLFDLNGFHGDSGAAIFNERGQICTTVSFIGSEKNDDQYWSLIGAFPLRFTAEQLKKAREFDGTQ